MKKIFNIISVVFAVCFLFSVNVSAEDENVFVKASVDNETDTVSVWGRLDTENKSKAAVYILQSGVENLDNMTADNIKQYIDHIEQVYTDENGCFSFEYKTSGAEGKRYIHAANYDSSSEADSFFTYTSKSTVNGYINKIEINRDPDNKAGDLAQRAACIRDILKSEYVLESLGIYEYELPCSIKFSDVGAAVFEYMASYSGEYGSKDDVKKAYLSCIAADIFNTADSNMLSTYFEQCRAYLDGLNEGIYSIYKNLGSDAENVNTKLKKYTFRSADDIVYALTEQITLYKFVRMSNYTEFMRFIDETNNAAGLDLTAYEAVREPYDRKNIDRAMLRNKDRIATLAEFKTEFSKQIEAELSRKITDSSEGSGGSGGGKGGSIVGNIKVDTVAPDSALNTSGDVFNDIGNVKWAKESIEMLAKRGIIAGYGDGSFRPNNCITREEAVKIIVAALEMYDDSAYEAFDDVESGKWYSSYVACAKRLGIVSGIGGNIFGVGRLVSREDVSVIIYNALSLLGSGASYKREYSGFADEAEISDYAKGAVEALYRANVINGSDQNTFRPKDCLTRAEMAKIMAAVLDITDGI